MAWQEPPDDLSLDNPLWQHALTLWGHERFAAHCLEAQSRGSAVTPILVALFCASRDRYVPAREPDDIAQWRKSVTADLRTLRMALPRDHSSARPLRETLKDAELKAEQVELAWWWRVLADNEPQPQPALSRAEIARHNLSSLLPELVPPLPGALVDQWWEIMNNNGEPS